MVSSLSEDPTSRRLLAHLHPPNTIILTYNASALVISRQNSLDAVVGSPLHRYPGPTPSREPVFEQYTKLKSNTKWEL
jgi:hypothetical protein